MMNSKRRKAKRQQKVPLPSIDDDDDEVVEAVEACATPMPSQRRVHLIHLDVSNEPESNGLSIVRRIHAKGSARRVRVEKDLDGPDSLSDCQSSLMSVTPTDSGHFTADNQFKPSSPDISSRQIEPLCFIEDETDESFLARRIEPIFNRQVSMYDDNDLEISTTIVENSLPVPETEIELSQEVSASENTQLLELSKYCFDNNLM